MLPRLHYTPLRHSTYFTDALAPTTLHYLTKLLFDYDTDTDTLQRKNYDYYTFTDALAPTTRNLHELKYAPLRPCCTYSARAQLHDTADATLHALRTTSTNARPYNRPSTVAPAAWRWSSTPRCTRIGGKQ